MYLCKNKNYEVNPQLFSSNLSKETILLKKWFNGKYFGNQALQAGTEIEFLMLDNEYKLTPHNISFVEQLNEPLVDLEAGSSQLEINSPALTIGDNFLSSLHRNSMIVWEKCCSLARQKNYHLALIGSMPHTSKNHCKWNYITPHDDYYLMNDRTLQHCKDQKLVIDIAGPKDHLHLKPESLAIEGLICSFQLHLAVKQNEAATYYNTIQNLSAPLVALASNAPYFYGKHTWSESRIAVFEQLYHFPLPTKDTVFFEPYFLKDSLFDLFQRNTQNYPYLVPIIDDEFKNHMSHVRRQNSSIFRWNRPIIDFNQKDEPYLRIEHRTLSSGPTIVDMIANAAFFYGIVYYFVKHQRLSTSSEALPNFYRAAQHGLQAQIHWDGKWINVCELLKELVPLATKGLEQLGINQQDKFFYLDIIRKRLANKQNGSNWQQAYIQKNGKNFPGMLAEYLKNQYQELPISDWNL